MEALLVAPAGVGTIWYDVEEVGRDEPALPTPGGVLVLSSAPSTGDVVVIERPPGAPVAPVRGVAGRRTIGFVLAAGVWGSVDSLVAALIHDAPIRRALLVGSGRPETVVERVSTVADQIGGRPPPSLREVEDGLRAGKTITAVCRSAGLERRRLSSEFGAVYGVGLKRFGRLCRFERALELARRADAPSLAVVAVMAGYADQAHMTREFRSLGRWSPGQLHRRTGPSPVHVHLDETFKTARR